MPDSSYEANDVLDLINTQTGKIILSVGTKNVADYYPYFLAEWNG